MPKSLRQLQLLFLLLVFLLKALPMQSGVYVEDLALYNVTVAIDSIGTTRIRHQCRKTAVLSCRRFLISSGV
jgi:hypothetical protein